MRRRAGGRKGEFKVASGSFRIDLNRAVSVLGAHALDPAWTTISRGRARAGARVPDGHLPKSVIELRAQGVLLGRIEGLIPGAPCLAFVDDPDLSGPDPEENGRARALPLAAEAATELLCSTCRAFQTLVAGCDPGELGAGVDRGAGKSPAQWLRDSVKRALVGRFEIPKAERAAAAARWLWDSAALLLAGRDLARLPKDLQVLFRAPLFFRPNGRHPRGPLLSLAEMEGARRATGFVPVFPGSASSRMLGLVRPAGAFDRLVLERVFPGALRDLTPRFEAGRRRSKARSEEAWRVRVKWMTEAGY